MALQLTLIRLHSSSKLDSIQGELYVNGVFFCHTIERLSTSIPRGRFPLVVSYSPRFHRLLPLLTVKGRSGIRIHSGNTSADSRGCILVGAGCGWVSIFGSWLGFHFAAAFASCLRRLARIEGVVHEGFFFV